jgi:hypothetical protein
VFCGFANWVLGPDAGTSLEVHIFVKLGLLALDKLQTCHSRFIGEPASEWSRESGILGEVAPTALPGLMRHFLTYC